MRWRGSAGEPPWCWILAGRSSGTKSHADWMGKEGKKRVHASTGRFVLWKLADKRTILGCLRGGATLELGGTKFGQISCEPRVVDVVDMVPRDGKSDLLRARLYPDAETYLYLGGEVFRDQSPDLSSAIWTKGNESPGPEALVLADDLYVPDERASTFMWLDMSQRQNFEDDISENLFNPKAAQ